MAGFVDGPGYLARFAAPQGLPRDAAGKLWACDTGNAWLRVVRD